jgi:hypothetical protein
MIERYCGSWHTWPVIRARLGHSRVGVLGRPGTRAVEARPPRVLATKLAQVRGQRASSGDPGEARRFRAWRDASSCALLQLINDGLAELDKHRAETTSSSAAGCGYAKPARRRTRAAVSFSRTEPIPVQKFVLNPRSGGIHRAASTAPPCHRQRGAPSAGCGSPSMHIPYMRPGGYHVVAGSQYLLPPIIALLCPSPSSARTPTRTEIVLR